MVLFYIFAYISTKKPRLSKILTFAPADLTLATTKAMEGFVVREIKPTDEYVFSIKKVLTPVFVWVNPYDETNN